MTHETPILPLDFWRQEIGYNPWHFWGLADANIVPVTSKCNDIVHQYGWQGTDEAGRDDIRRAIVTAENLVMQHLNHWPAPIYGEATVPWPRYFDQRLFRYDRMGSQGGWVPVQLHEGHIQVCGVKTYDELNDAALLVFTDQDGDGLKDTFTCTAPVPLALTDPTEVAAYFQPGDRLVEDSELSDRWRIEPVHVTILAGVATITGKRWLVVKPVLYENSGKYPIDPTVDSNFVTSLYIYWRHTKLDGLDSNVDSQAALIWESRPCSWGCGCSGSSSSDPASEGWVAGRSGVRNSILGIVTPAEGVYNATTGLWSHPCECFDSCGEPDRVLVRYLAGLPLDTHGWMDKSMRTLVSRLACAEMTRRICACDAANREWSNWQFDVSRINSPETYQIDLETLSNPLGTRRGHLYAWSQFKSPDRALGFIF